MSFLGFCDQPIFFHPCLFIFPGPPFSFCTVSDRTQFLQTQSSCPWEKTWYNTWRRMEFTVFCICWGHLCVFVAEVFVYLLLSFFFLICRQHVFWICCSLSDILSDKLHIVHLFAGAKWLHPLHWASSAHCFAHSLAVSTCAMRQGQNIFFYSTYQTWMYWGELLTCLMLFAT